MRFGFATLFALFAACGPPGRVVGLIDGEEFVVREVVLLTDPGQRQIIKLASVTDLCRKLGHGDPANARMLTMSLDSQDLIESERGPGKYRMSQSSYPHNNYAHLQKTDGQCAHVDTWVTEHEGFVMLEAIDPGGSARGTFDLTLVRNYKEQLRLTGEFNAHHCEPVKPYLAKCQQ